MTDVGIYTVVVERSDGRETGERFDRVSHTGHPRAGEEIQIGERRYRVTRVCHVDATPPGSLHRVTSPLVHVRPARS